MYASTYLPFISYPTALVKKHQLILTQLYKMSKYQYYYPQNTEEGEKLSLGRDQSSGGAILSCLWFERPLLHAVYMIAYQTRFTPAQAYNRLWSTRPPSCPAQNNSRHGEVLAATVPPLLAIPHKGFHREAVPEGPF